MIAQPIGILSDVARGDDLKANILRDVGDTLYREGINATGVDRLSEAAGVSKRTLYHHFPSKDALVTASLDARSEGLAAMLVEPGESARAAGRDETDQILAVFRSLSTWTRSDQYRGCPYLNALVELPDRSHPARAVARRHKELVRAWFRATAKRGHLAQPEALSWQLMMLFDGAMIDAELHRSEPIAARALQAATVLVTAAAPTIT